jgi:hypothetical protein
MAMGGKGQSGWWGLFGSAVLVSATIMWAMSLNPMLLTRF